MASGDTLVVFTPLCNEPPASNYATINFRNNHPVLEFDQSTDEAAVFTGIMPRGYAGGGVTVYIHWLGDGVTSGNVVWDAQFERMDTGTDLDADSFAAVQSVTDAAPTTDGAPEVASIAFTNGAQMDSVAAGEAFRLKINRDADNGSDTMAADAQLLAVEIKET